MPTVSKKLNNLPTKFLGNRSKTYNLKYGVI